MPQETNAEIKVIAPPSPEDIVKTAAESVYNKLTAVDDRMKGAFTGAAKRILEQGGDP